VFVTHTAAESSMQEILADLRELPAVRRVGSLLRVVDGAPVSSGTQRQ
jgi:hypothetical protein